MTPHHTHMLSAFMACVIAAVYLPTLIVFTFDLIGGNRERIGTGWLLCVTGGALFGLFLMEAIFA